ncbi:MAG: putative porin, partial [Bacteroidota bacterium]
FDQFDYYGYRTTTFDVLDTAGTKKSRIEYHIGSKKEQHLNLNHYQHLNKGFRFGVTVGSHSTPGDLLRQLSSGRRLMISGAYLDTNSRYSAIVTYRFHRLFNEENGGMSSDSSFEKASSLDTRTLPIYLDNAGASYRQNQYDVNQSFKIRNASATLPGWEVFHKLSLTRSSFVFQSENPDSGYFNLFLVDSTSTYDSTFHQRLNNQFGVRYIREGSETTTSFGAGAWLENSNYKLNGYDAVSYNQLMMLFSLDLLGEKSSAAFQWLQSMDSLSEINTSLSTDAGDYGKLMLQMRYRSERPAEQMLYYTSNHFSWVNNFANTRSLLVNINHKFEKPQFEYGADFRLVTGFVYSREDALPQQFTKQLAYGRAYLKKGIQLGKFGLNQQLVYSFSGNENVIRLPDINYFGSVYYRNLFFKKALDLRCGLDANVWSSYFSYGYMPATAVFYLQDFKKTGGFPMLGLFVDLKIKTAVISLRLDHFNSGIGNRAYYGSYRYPLQGRTLKIGVAWNLID